ncbi:cytochrome c family protein [Desulfovibrio ferrophilus]|uniref:Cytochrome c family protein n=1 Tax=Desulfovibrio ferrophilus TaxID=241368 RepID=A0A2Z6B2C0_9BACT|nr:cytochrome c family protein [Desulfovibrio ferrophilus]BBD09652.1 cytochrome c family protein [Desulfovibrio ferrophilus]
MKNRVVVFIACAVCVSLSLLITRPAQTGQATYVGSNACSECHDEQFENFEQFAKKAHSDRSIKIMASDLTKEELQECYACHTTGYGQPGGFVSFEETPEMAHAGCEVCHGPGSEHVAEGGDPDLIKGTLALEDCETCHNADRVGAFNFKPLLYGGAH